MAFVVNGVCRYTVHGTYQGRETANVLDYFIDTTGSWEQRNDAIFLMAGILINEWSDSVLPKVMNSYSATSVTWVDLDEADGSTGQRNVTSNHTWPKAGTQPSVPTPANVAILVKKLIVRKRGARNGRIYIPGITENDTGSTNGNQLQGSTLTGWSTAMTAFLGDTNQNNQPYLGGSYNSWMVVSHILTREPPKKLYQDGTVAVPGDPLTGEGLKVTSLVVDGTFATQRRRLRG